jgi:16S rRNA (adenine1518-N6/adenine1519-N6)-dimethyltransferase
VARQKLGQHFLANGTILQKIAAAARERSADSSLAVEIGPGKGALTQQLLSQFQRVVTVELDPFLAQHVRERWQNEPRLEVVEKDALEADWRAWGPGVLVGNLPYYVSTAIISSYVRYPGSLAPATFLIQKEVAERITARPGNREYGYFSVECQLLATTEYLFDVPPGAFKPPPKVDSAVIRLTPLAQPEGFDAGRFLSFVSACFRQKRKTLRNNLSERYSRGALDLQPEMGRRAEQLSVSQLLDLYRALSSAEAPASNATPKAPA